MRLKPVFQPTKPDPRVLILQIVCASITAFSLTSWKGLVLLFAAAAVVVTLLQSPGRGIRACAVYALLLFFFWGAGRTALPVISGILPLFFLLMLRVYPVYLLCGVLVHRAPMNELLSALSHWRIPQGVLIPLAVVYRYIPTITREIAYVGESQKMRRLNPTVFGALRHPVQTAEGMLIPLLYRSEKIAEELSAASLCKGLTIHRRRTCCADVRLGWRDLCYTVGIAAVTALVLYTGRF